MGSYTVYRMSGSMIQCDGPMGCLTTIARTTT